MSKSIENLETLLNILANDKDFSRLPNFYKKDNLYDIVGMNNQEIRHSNTIAWFLENSESFYKKFINLLTSKKDFLSAYCNINIIREQEKNIDILIKSDKYKFVICVENKIGAGIHGDQLNNYYNHVCNKYKSYEKLFVFLSPHNGREVLPNEAKSHKEWIPIGYESISEIFDTLKKEPGSDRIKHVIEDYTENLRKKGVVKNVEKTRLLAEFYGKHKAAVDELIKYVKDGGLTDGDLKIKEVVVDTMKNLNRDDIFFLSNEQGPLILRFKTRKMNEYFPKKGDDYGFSGRCYSYEFRLKEPNKFQLILTFAVHCINQGDKKKMEEIADSLYGNQKKPNGKTWLPLRSETWQFCTNYKKLSEEKFDETRFKEDIRESIEKILEWEKEFFEQTKGYEK